MKRRILGLAALTGMLLLAPRAKAQVDFQLPFSGETVPAGSDVPVRAFALPSFYFSAMFQIDNQNLLYPAQSNDSTMFSLLAPIPLMPGPHTFTWIFDDIYIYGPYPFYVAAPVPTLTAISPASAPLGSGEVTLTVTGTNFNKNSTIQWNGYYTLITRYVSPTTLTAQLDDRLFSAAGTVEISVSNPAPGGGKSAFAIFTIGNSVPKITSISPDIALHGDPGFPVTVTGTSFTPQSKVLWNGTALTTTFVSTTSLRAAVPAADFLTPGAAVVKVSNPAGVSAGSTFTIK